MKKTSKFLLLSLAIALAFAMAAYGQDETPPSLGDVARKSRLQRQQRDAESAKSGEPANPSPAAAPAAQSKDALAKGTPAKAAPGATTVSKDDQHPGTAKKVITNDEIPEHIGPTSTRPGATKSPVPEYVPTDYSNQKIPAEYWQSRIQSQKNAIASLKSDIESVSESIQYAGANCVSNCVQWNERQQQKQQQVEAMKLQLEDAEKQLEAMQDAARKQGYGTSVYDP